MKIGVIGNGFVGKATSQLKCKDIKLFAYDINPEHCDPKGIEIIDLLDCEILFISVPTPMSKDGSCFLNIIKSVLNDLNDINYSGFIVLRSTVPVGTSNDLNIYFMPEFLTEKNFINDFIENKQWIFGLLNNKQDDLFIKKIRQLFTLAHDNNRIKYNDLFFMLNSEAEMVKMFKNCFLATKVSFCNEMYSYCQKKQIDYNKVRYMACMDKRILHNHTMVPGHDGKLGFGGTCFPKDMASLKYDMDKHNVTCPIITSAIIRNESIDRPEKDWQSDHGRAFINK